jgi:hypothetical protein
LARQCALPLELKDALLLLVLIDSKDLRQSLCADVNRKTGRTAIVLTKCMSGIAEEYTEKLTENLNGFKLPISIMSTSRSRPSAKILINLPVADG